MKEKPSLELKRLRKSLNKAVNEFSQFFGKDVSDTFLEKSISVNIDSVCLDLFLMEYLRWKAIMIKEALKCNDFSHMLELDHTKCSIGQFILDFTPPDETSKRLMEEIARVHEKLHSEFRKLSEVLKSGQVDCEDVKKRLKQRLFPLLNELVDLLTDLSHHIEKLEAER